ncbi:MAG: FmdE family protein, partial [Dehalococcoidales bacterium]|nr:FmdE family protein [Dehalococcoidales bacterium]
PRQKIEKAIAANDLHKLLAMSGMVHGHFCPGLALGVKAAARAVRELRARSSGMEELIAIVETNSCFSDGVQFVTGCSFGNNGLSYRDYGKTVLTLVRRAGESVRVAAKPDRPSLEDRYPEVAMLFTKVVKERRGTEEDEKKLRRLWIEVSFKTLDIPDEELSSISWGKMEVPAYSSMFSRVTCSVCGEKIMEPRARLKDGQPICIPCLGQPYSQLAGDGISITKP